MERSTRRRVRQQHLDLKEQDYALVSDDETGSEASMKESSSSSSSSGGFWTPYSKPAFLGFLPTLLSFMFGGADIVGELFCLLLGLYWLNKIIRVPWEIYSHYKAARISLMSAPPFVASSPSTGDGLMSPILKPTDPATLHWRAKELFVCEKLALFAICVAPSIGALGLYAFRLAFPHHGNVLSTFNLIVFVLAASIRPFQEAMDSAKKHAVDLSVEIDRELQAQRLSESNILRRLEIVERQLSLLRNTTDQVRETTEEAVAALRRDIQHQGHPMELSASITTTTSSNSSSTSTKPQQQPFSGPAKQQHHHRQLFTKTTQQRTASHIDALPSAAAAAAPASSRVRWIVGLPPVRLFVAVVRHVPLVGWRVARAAELPEMKAIEGSSSSNDRSTTTTTSTSTASTTSATVDEEKKTASRDAPPLTRRPSHFQVVVSAIQASLLWSMFVSLFLLPLHVARFALATITSLPSHVLSWGGHNSRHHRITQGTERAFHHHTATAVAH